MPLFVTRQCEITRTLSRRPEKRRNTTCESDND